MMIKVKRMILAQQPSSPIFSLFIDNSQVTIDISMHMAGKLELFILASSLAMRTLPLIYTIATSSY